MYPPLHPTLTVQVRQNKRPKSLVAVKQKCVLAVNTVGRRLCKQAELVLRRTDCGRPFPVGIPFTATTAPPSRADCSCGRCWRRNMNEQSSPTPMRTGLSKPTQAKSKNCEFYLKAQTCVEIAGNICFFAAGSAPPPSPNCPELSFVDSQLRDNSFLERQCLLL